MARTKRASRSWSVSCLVGLYMRIGLMPVRAVSSCPDRHGVDRCAYGDAQVAQSIREAPGGNKHGSTAERQFDIEMVKGGIDGAEVVR